MTFSVFTVAVFLNASPAYGYNPADVQRVLSGDKNLSGADLTITDLIEAVADSRTQFPQGFDAKAAGLIIK
jgi:hypothetical protein